MADTTGIPAPPPGFVDVDESTQPQQQQNTAAPSAGTIPPPPPGFVDEDDSNQGQGILDSAKAFASGVNKTISGAFATVDDAASKVPVIGSWLTTPIGGDHSAAASQAYRQNERNYTNSVDVNHQTAEGLGRAAGTVGEMAVAGEAGAGIGNLGNMLLGDEALSGLSLSERLMRAGKMAQTIEQSPMLQRVVNAGMGALKFGSMSAAVEGLNTGNASKALDAGAVGAATGGVLGAAAPEIDSAIDSATSALGDASNAVGNAVGRAAGAVSDAAGNAVNKATGVLRNTFSTQAVKDASAATKQGLTEDEANQINQAQGDFHDSIRSLMQNTAGDAGVDIPDNASTSLRNSVQNVADAVRAKAKGLYGQIDEALGGTRFQAFDEQIGNVRDALRNDTGVDPDKTDALNDRLADLTTARDAALDQAEENGVPRSTIRQANQAFRQSSALNDLSKALQGTVSGIRPELAQQGVNTASEVVSPDKLATRLDRLYNSGRLQQALGQDGAEDLLQSTHAAQQRAVDIRNSIGQRVTQAESNAAARTAAVKRNRIIAGVATGGAVNHYLHLLPFIE